MPEDQTTPTGEPDDASAMTVGRESVQLVDDARRKRLIRIGILAVLGLVYIRVVLFAWMFPLVEQYVDDPGLETQGIVESIETLDRP